MKEKFYEIASVKDIDTFFAKCSYIYGTEIDKYNEGFEYEIKLDFSNEKNINVVNKIVSNLLEQSYNYVINRCEMLMYDKEASNRKQEIDRQHHTIPNKRLKDKHYGNVHNRLWNHG